MNKELRYAYFGDKYAKRPKYSNRSCICMNPKHAPHASILEADVCRQLQIMLKAGEIKSYQTQYLIPIEVKGKKIANHIVDFLVRFKDGHYEFWEAKGFEQDLWKLKKKLVEAIYPKVPYIVKFEKPKYFKGFKK